MARRRTIKYPPKRGKIPRSKIQKAVREVLEARGVRVVLPRDTYKYHLKRGDEVIRSGITNDLNRREREQRGIYGQDVYLQQVGRKTTREDATAWKRKQKPTRQ